MRWAASVVSGYQWLLWPGGVTKILWVIICLALSIYGKVKGSPESSWVQVLCATSYYELGDILMRRWPIQKLLHLSKIAILLLDPIMQVRSPQKLQRGILVVPECSPMAICERKKHMHLCCWPIEQKMCFSRILKDDTCEKSPSSQSDSSIFATVLPQCCSASTFVVHCSLALCLLSVCFQYDKVRRQSALGSIKVFSRNDYYGQICAPSTPQCFLFSSFSLAEHWEKMMVTSRKVTLMGIIFLLLVQKHYFPLTRRLHWNPFVRTQKKQTHGTTTSLTWSGGVKIGFVGWERKAVSGRLTQSNWNPKVLPSGAFLQCYSLQHLDVMLFYRFLLLLYCI